MRWFGLDCKRAVAHTLVPGGVFWNGAGATTLGILESIHWQWLPALLLGSLMGSLMGGYKGVHLSIVKGNRWTKWGFEVIAFLVGSKLLIG